MLTIYSDDHRLHHGRGELMDGVIMPVVETPARADQVLARVRAAALGPVAPPVAFGRAPLARVHDGGYLDFLEGAWADWIATHGPDTDGLPMTWPVVGGALRRDRLPESIDGKLGYYGFDAGTPVTAGTWKASTAAADVALTGAARVTDGARGVFSLCRPPGHHAAADLFGGYCFLNNAAIAAQWLCDQGAARVAILDVDYHHGNGTQAIFYDRADVLFVSLHADPSQEFPYFLGYADETGRGDGDGFTLNLPLRWGTDWSGYGAALDRALARIDGFGPDVLVVSLGLDTFERDPISRFRLRSSDYPVMGDRLARLRRPTLFVFEGGYAVDALGENTVLLLAGFEAAA